MAGLDPAIYDFLEIKVLFKVVDARHKVGHDGGGCVHIPSKNKKALI
jgi:hypothetical protein